MPTILEIIAVVFSGISVWLTVKKNILLWPTGIVGIVAFFFLFLHNRLYSDTILQVVFFALSVYGWVTWHTVEKTHAPMRNMFGTGTNWPPAMGFVGGVAISQIGKYMAQYTNAAFPMWDAAILVLSVYAQLLLMLRYRENWFFWIAVNIISVVVYTKKDLYLTATEYVVFLIMCVFGAIAWYREPTHV